MTNEKLIQSPECYEDEVCFCPLCGSPMQYECDLSIETGSLELFTRCYQCGHIEIQ